jgi:hypothetical protein
MKGQKMPDETTVNFIYMPILKSKQGEQIALRNMKEPQLACTLPLIELLPLAVKPSKKSLTELKNDYLQKTATWMLKARLDTYPVAIDTAAYFDSSQSACTTLITICKYLSLKSIRVIPVLYPSLVFAFTQELQEQSFPVIILRLKINNTNPVEASEIVRTVKKVLPKKTEIHLVLDAQSVYGRSAADLYAAAAPILNAVQAIPGIESVTYSAGGFPENLSGIKKGAQNYIPRVEWNVWNSLFGDSKTVRFGDYSVTHPDLQGDIDPTTMNVSAQIRYARKNDWWLLKAGGVRTLNSGGMKQYNQLCQLLILSKDYAGPPFSYGDLNYDAHTAAGASTGSFMTWRRDATNHHLARTITDLATQLSVSIV